MTWKMNRNYSVIMVIIIIFIITIYYYCYSKIYIVYRFTEFLH